MYFRQHHILSAILVVIIIGCTKFVYITQDSPDSLVEKLGFKEKVDYLIDSAGKDAIWSVVIREYPSSKTIYSKNPDFNLIPASNVKLFTTAAGLKFLGSDYRFTTSFMTDGLLDTNGVLKGNLYIIGGGDPTFDEEFLDDNPISVLVDWSQKLRDLGIISVEGDVVGIDSFFTPKSLEKSWEWGDLRYYYAAPCGALSYNNNCLKLEIGASENGPTVLYNWYPELQDISIISDLEKAPFKENTDISASWLYPDSVIYISGWIEPGRFENLYLPVIDASMFFMKTMTMVFDYSGPVIMGEIKLSDNRSFAYDTLFVHYSPFLKDVVKVINTESSNFDAEQLLRTLGKEIFREGSPDSGLKVIRNMFESTLINSEKPHLVDGSGLSRHNWVSSRTFVEFLNYCKNSEFSDSFISSLPEYSEGTLEERNVQIPGNCRVKVKTGTMSGVRSHSGYLFSKKKYYVFSIICNNFTCSAKQVENIIDQIITDLSIQ